MKHVAFKQEQREATEGALADLIRSQGEVGQLCIEASLPCEARDTLQQSLDQCQLELERLQADVLELRRQRDTDGQQIRWLESKLKEANELLAVKRENLKDEKQQNLEAETALTINQQTLVRNELSYVQGVRDDMWKFGYEEGLEQMKIVLL